MPTFEVLGLQFGVSKTEANDTFREWLLILRQLLPASLLDQVAAQASDYALVQELLEQFRLLVDSTEQARQRPGNNEHQQSCFSGKKKQHTIKNQLLSLPQGKDIVDAVVGATGPTSDIALFRQQQLRLSPQQQFEGDKAYLGEEAISTPHKKPPKAQLTDEQRAANRILSSRRIFIEHLIRLVKIFRVAKEQFRLHRDTYERVILAVCGLVRLRIGAFVLPQFP